MSRLLLIPLVAFSFMFSAGHIHAQTNTGGSDYQLLQPLPLINPSGQADTQVTPEEYVQGVIKLAVAVAGAMAVFEIIVAGVEYMSTDAYSGKKEGKKRLTNAVLGFIFVIASWLILNTINPNLVDINLSIKSQQAYSLNASSTPPANGAGTCGVADNVGNSNCGPVTTLLAGIDKKGPGGDCTIDHCPAGSGCSATTCYVDQALAAKLETLNGALGGQVGWTITEMAPPTVTHADSCHTSGTCVDATLNNPTVDNIVTFFQALDQNGLNYEYEVCDSTLRSSLQSNSKLQKWSGKFKCESTTQNGASGQSMHIEL